MKVHLARQPIFRKNFSVFGYELLYRGNNVVNEFDPTMQGDVASSSVLMDAFAGIGIENMAGASKVFINFTESLLASEIATLFPPDRLVVEVLENVAPVGVIIEKCAALKKSGYTIALDDFSYSPKYNELVSIADIIKIDFRAASEADIIRSIMRTKRPELRYLAEKVETYEEYQAAVRLGFTLFQGYFLSRPVIVTGHRLRPLPVNYFRLLKTVNKEDFNIREVQDIISQDISLTFDVLKLVNSAAFGFRQRIRTVQHALVALGLAGIRKWLSLVVLSGINKNQPVELIKMSLIRANFIHNLASYVGEPEETVDALFMTGLFSMMDIIMNRTFSVLFQEIFVPKPVSECLESQRGPYMLYYRMMLTYERGEWDEVGLLTLALKLTPDQVSDAYVHSLRRCEQIFGKS